MLDGMLCQCKRQSHGHTPQPHRARTALPMCQQHVWVGNRHPMVPRVAMPDLVVDSGLPGAVCSCCVRARRKAQVFSWPRHGVPVQLPGVAKAVCPSCTLCGVRAAAGCDGKADLCLCLLPRGCRAIKQLLGKCCEFLKVRITLLVAQRE